MGSLSAAPWGSSSIPISWMYIKMIGAEIEKASQVSILNEITFQKIIQRL